ncbi:restriction endonuclease subunit S [Vibrio cholerae]|nr:restriction endonuclease subunit S [Vibrio cholerae]EKF9706687.1 restriction endonuclease subunit S [Vibrio cholerae]EKF9719502.1 restriction endonuclease subunit S [Vibrio cholerae]
MSGVAEVSPKYLTEAASNAVPVVYKQTEVGVIPKDWEVFSLPDVIWYQEGPGLRKWQFKSKGLKVINVTNLQESGNLDLDRTDRHISWDEFEKTYKHFACDEGDLVIASSGNSYCKASIVRACDLPLLMNTSVIRFKPIGEFSKGYMEVYLKSPYFKDQIDLLITGGAQPNFGPAHLNLIKIPAPTCAKEQTAIANALSDVDALISELEKLIAKKQAIKTATMQQLLTGRTRLPQFALREDGMPKGTKPSELGEIPEDWEVVTLGAVSSFINGRAYSLHEWENSGTPVIRLQNLTGRGDEYYYSNLQLPEKQYCKYGDLLFMWSATFGPVIWRGPKAIYHYHIWKIACEVGYSQSYLFYLLDDMTEKLKRSSSSGGTMLHVTKEKMESTKAAFPSYEEQTAIATILSDMDAEIQALEQRLGKTRHIKQGMMQELLTGKTRLIQGSEAR